MVTRTSTTWSGKPSKRPHRIVRGAESHDPASDQEQCRADQDETSDVMGTAPDGAFGSTFLLYLP
jgi:hypothetical protein